MSISQNLDYISLLPNTKKPHPKLPHHQQPNSTDLTPSLHSPKVLFELLSELLNTHPTPTHHIPPPPPPKQHHAPHNPLPNPPPSPPTHLPPLLDPPTPHHPLALQSHINPPQKPVAVSAALILHHDLRRWEGGGETAAVFDVGWDQVLIGWGVGVALRGDVIGEFGVDGLRRTFDRWRGKVVWGGGGG